MNKQIRIFLAGVLMVIPFAVTIWILWSIATWLGGIGYGLFDNGCQAITGKDLKDIIPSNDWRTFVLSLSGAIIVLVGIYIVGQLTHSLMFRRLVDIAERMIQRVPGVKTIYESVRDLLKLFGSGSGRMGKVVLYHPNGGEMAMLGVLTNEHPAGLAGIGDHEMVSLYMPFAFMLGGAIVYVPRKHLRELDIPVEKALKLCATAEISPAPSDAKILICPPGLSSTKGDSPQG